MIIRKKYFFLLLLVAVFMTVACNGCELFFKPSSKTVLLPFEPFTMDAHKLILTINNQDLTGEVMVIDTESDAIIRKIRFTNCASLYTVAGNDKIYVVDEGAPWRGMAGSLWVVYPDRGNGKTIDLDWGHPSELVYNDAKKELLAMHFSEWESNRQAVERGGTIPFSVIDARRDTLVKTLWDWDYFDWHISDANGIYYGQRIFVHADQKLRSFNTETKENVVIDSNFIARGGGGLVGYYETHSLKVSGNDLYGVNYLTGEIRIYNTESGQLVSNVSLSYGAYSSTNLSLDCIDYYAPSNFVIVGGRYLAVVDLNHGKTTWLTNYHSNFRVNNGKLYVSFHNQNSFNRGCYFRRVDVLDITNGFKKIKQIDY